MQTSTEVENPDGDGTLIVHVKEETTRVRFEGLRARPVLSVLRQFSAPVKLTMATPEADLRFLARHDSDGFSRWDAMQRLLTRALEGLRTGSALPRELVELFAELLDEARVAVDDGEQKALFAVMLELPAQQYLYELAIEIDVEGIHRAHERARRELADALFDRLTAVYEANRATSAYVADGVGIARRSLANLALGYLAATGEGARRHEVHRLLVEQLENADNLTDRLAALREIVNAPTFDESRRSELLTRFYDRWSREKLVVDHWFNVQAACTRDGALRRVLELERHPAFDNRNPNRARAVYGPFTANLTHFHAADGSGHAFIGERAVTLDAANPQLAARLMKALTQWQRHQPVRKRSMQDALRAAAKRDNLSKDLYEVVTKGLEA